MQVQVLVTVEVEPNDPNDDRGSTGEFQDVAVEAVKNAVEFAHDNGFSHALAESVSIGLAAVELLPESEELLEIQYKCPKCGHTWQETYSCACDSTCPQCGTNNITALSYKPAGSAPGDPAGYSGYGPELL